MRTAVYCATRNLYHDMLVSAKSMLYYDAADEIVCLIEDDALPEPVPDCIHTRNVSKQRWFDPNGPNFSRRWTYMVLLRAVYTQIFPDRDVVLSLDVDNIAQRDVSGIWRTDLTGAYYAATREVLPGRDRTVYAFGVTLLNLAALRDGTDMRIAHLLNTERLESPEQDAFGRICAGHIAELPPEYCTTWYNRNFAPAHAVRIHNYTNDVRIYNELYYYRRFDKLDWDAVLERMCVNASKRGIGAREGARTGK